MSFFRLRFWFGWRGALCGWFWVGKTKYLPQLPPVKNKLCMPFVRFLPFAFSRSRNC